MGWTIAKLAVSAVAALTVAVLGGCGTVPIVSDAKQWGHASLSEQQDWVEAQIDGALDVLGPPEGWWEADRGFQWPRDREMLIDAAATATCQPSKSGAQPGQLVFELHHDGFGDPTEAAMRLRTHWAEEGWDVSDIGDPRERTDGMIAFRADREDGALLAFDGNEIFIRLGVFSSCSDDATVTMRY